MRKILSIILSTAMVIALFANTNIAQARADKAEEKHTEKTLSFSRSKFL